MNEDTEVEVYYCVMCGIRITRDLDPGEDPELVTCDSKSCIANMTRRMCC